MFGKTRMQFLVVVSMFFMASCDSIYEDLPRCELWLEFTFDHNMEYADAFDPQVNSVDVFVFGDDDKLLLTKRAEPTALVGGNRMSLADEPSLEATKYLPWAVCPIATGWRLIPDNRRLWELPLFKRWLPLFIVK